MKQLRGTRAVVEPQYPSAPVPDRAVPGVLAPPNLRMAPTPWDNGSSSLGHLIDGGDWGMRHIAGWRGTASWDHTRLSVGCLGEKSRVGKRRTETV